MARNSDKAARRIEREIVDVERDIRDTESLMKRFDPGSYEHGQLAAHSKVLSRKLRKLNDDLDSLIGEW